ncbi:MAG: hypothetical protein K8R36_22850, partial [Planctomycetales bacterium]|nr:hypothetical protein [Planctomycetales bacterium]
MNRSIHFVMLLLFLPLTAGVAAESTPTAWEMLPYRVHVLTAVESSPSLPPKFEQELPSDLVARIPSIVGGAWRLESGAAPAELRHRILHSPTSLTGDDIPAAAKKGDKVIFLGIAAGENGYVVRARELDLITGLWNITTTRIVPQAASVKQEAIWSVIAAFAPHARIEKVEDRIVTLKLRAAALARRDENLPLLLSGTVFRPVLVKCDAHGTMLTGTPESIPWTYLIPTESKTTSSPLTARLESGLSGTFIPEYHPTRMRLALGVSPSRDATKIKLVAEGSGAPLEGYEVALQEPEVAGKPGAVSSLGRSGSDGIVEVPS